MAGARLWTLLAGALMALPAHAQYKLSEVMQHGGKIMAAKDIRAELTGAKIAGVNEFGMSFDLQLKNDGKLEGTVFTPRGPSGLAGTWSVNAKNQICTELTFTATGNTASRCVWYWKAGSEYYSTNSQADAEAAGELVECMIANGADCKRDFALSPRSVSR